MMKVDQTFREQLKEIKKELNMSSFQEITRRIAISPSIKKRLIKEIKEGGKIL